MAYENKTVDYVYDLLISSFKEKFNGKLKLLPKSFVNVLSKVLAAVYIVPFKLCGWFYLQLFPDTASYDEVDINGKTVIPLIKLGDLFGVTQPMAGEAWEGKVKVRRTMSGQTLTAGTQLKNSANGLVYYVSESADLDEEETEVSVYCAESGTAGNLDAGDVLSFVSPLEMAETDTTVTETTTEGTDDETEEAYRRRVVNRYRTQPQGGALSDYRIWAYDVAGVLQVYPYNDENSPGGVLVYVAGDTSLYPDRIPDSALLKAVGEACTYDPDTGLATRKPVTAVLDPDGDGSYANIKAVSVTKFDVKVTGLNGAAAGNFGSTLKSELENYFYNREPYIRGLSDDNNKTNQILRNSVISTANSVALSLKATFDTATVETGGEEVAVYTLGQGELCALGDLYINGELYEG